MYITGGSFTSDANNLIQFVNTSTTSYCDIIGGRLIASSASCIGTHGVLDLDVGETNTFTTSSPIICSMDAYAVRSDVTNTSVTLYNGTIYGASRSNSIVVNSNVSLNKRPNDASYTYSILNSSDSSMGITLYKNYLSRKAK